MSKKRIAQILVPLFMIVGVAAIWITQNTNSTAQAQNSEDATQENTDFAIDADTIDLEALTAYGLPMIIDFGADECVPCVEMAPVLQTLNADLQGQAIIKFVDVWKYPNAADGFPLQVIPTQVIINADGTPYLPSEELAEQIGFTMYERKETSEHVYTVHQGGLTEEQMLAILADMGVE